MVQKSLPKKGIKFLDGDTIISPGSIDATIDAVGSVIQAIEGVEKKKFKNAFCCCCLFFCFSYWDGFVFVLSSYVVVSPS